MASAPPPLQQHRREAELTTTQKRGRTDVPLARRPVKRPEATNARVQSSRAFRRRQAIRSPAVLPSPGGIPSRFSYRLFVWADGCVAFVSLRLCGCDELRTSSVSSLCVSVPLWFSGWDDLKKLAGSAYQIVEVEADKRQFRSIVGGAESVGAANLLPPVSGQTR